ncbi:MAG: rhodanese-like domain-containing protein [Tissierellia bacterium]|nr:rhodanese-like domain-containing protein [Tissierellia bacterium]
MRNKSLKFISVLLLLAMVLSGCSQPATETAETTEAATTEAAAATNEMKYVTPEDLKADIEGNTGEYVVLDVRKIADYDTAHIDGSISADLDAAKEGDDEDGKAKLKAALKEATGDEAGKEGTKYALVCYSGKSYAQKGTDLLIDLGVPADSIFTLEGGVKAWEDKGDDYKSLMK